MRRLLSIAATSVLLASVACGVHAQQFKWTDANGRTVYGDTPPPGVKATPLRGPVSPAPVPAPRNDAAKDSAGKDAAAKAVRKGPLTPAEQEQEFRKRQQEAAKARAKEEQEAKQTAAQQENCRNAQEMVRTLQSGQRIQRTSASGERYYLDEAGSAAELARTQKVAEESCK